LHLIDNLEILTDSCGRFASGDLRRRIIRRGQRSPTISTAISCAIFSTQQRELTRQLNLIDPFKVWTWEPASRKPYRGYPKKQLPMCTGIESSFTAYPGMESVVESSTVWQ